MADLLQNSAKSRLQAAIWTLKLAFLLIGLVATVMLLKLSIIYSLNLLFWTLPRVWISIRSWLSPPYIYIFVNLIIVTIAASSTFHQKLSDKKNDQQHEKTPRQIFSGESPSDSDEKKPVSVGFAFRETVEHSPEAWSDISCVTDSDQCSPETVQKPLALPSFTIKGTVADDKSSVSTHFAVGKSVPATENRQRSVKLSTSEKAPKSLGVAKSKKSDTLDATWKAITDERSKRLSRHLRKSDTWEAPPRVERLEPEPISMDRRELKKSETFSESSSVSSGSASSRGSGIRRERSLSQDELNGRVEAFIKKFNDEIRLERQKSYKNYMEMVHRGSY